MIDVQLDEKEIEKLFLEELKKRLDHIEQSRTLWDMEKLCQQTCMSVNTIKDKFFYDRRFPKYKVGGKWMFPASECEDFLLMWLKEQPTN